MTERTLVIDTDKFLEANVPIVSYTLPKGTKRVIEAHGRRFAELEDGNVIELKSDAKPVAAKRGVGIDRSSYYGR